MNYRCKQIGLPACPNCDYHIVAESRQIKNIFDNEQDYPQCWVLSYEKRLPKLSIIECKKYMASTITLTSEHRFYITNTVRILLPDMIPMMEKVMVLL